MKNVTDNRKMIAGMIHEIWNANRNEVMDRSSALSMFISNLEHEERENTLMLYDNGNLTPDQFIEAKEYWCSIEKENRETEFPAILDIVEKLEW